jgi:hypothetical protein
LISEADQGFILSVKEWTTPIYYSTENDRKYDVKLTALWAPENTLNKVNIPDHAEPDPSIDGHMVIINKSNGCVYDFWEAKKTNNGWKAAWTNALPVKSNDIFETGLSARGSGFELTQGLNWPEELENGEINHVFIFSFNHSKSGGPVWPATESEGTSKDKKAIPEGALVPLDPKLDLSTMNLKPFEIAIAKALQ